MKVEIVIQRVVLDGVVVPPAGAAAFATPLGARLGDLLQAAPPALDGLTPTDRLRGATVSLEAGDAAGLVEQIAHSLHGALLGPAGSGVRKARHPGRQR